MLQDGVGFFGLPSANVPVSVGGGGGGGSLDNAAFVSQSVPTSMTAGQSYPIVIRMRNTGTTTWSAGTYMLGSQNPQGNMTWGLKQVVLPVSVAPNSETTFSYNVTAPATAGTYSFQWQMLQGGGSYFGAMTPNMSVSVTAATGTPPAITTTSMPFGRRGSFYSVQMSATGGTSPYSWSMTGAPSGVSINRSTGLVSGTPTVVGTFIISVKVTDAAGLTASKSYKVLFQ
jgi:hypothetical protein